VHHLVKSGEILGAMLMTEHNLWFYQRLMQGLRNAIGEQRVAAFATEFLGRYRSPAKAGAQALR
jgi:queuine tRNA-ribosyltransferase